MPYSTEVMYRVVRKGEGLIDRSRRLTEDLEWLIENEERLRKEYPDKFVAIQKKSVKFSADNMEDLLSAITSSGKNASDFITHYLTKAKRTFLF